MLFGDLVGFTPLSESRDPEEVRELLSRYFEECRTVIGRYGGAVEKFIGDAVMAVWGVPLAHEDDAERAVRAGLELVQTVAAMGEDVGAPGLAMRVGVVTGEVAVTVGATAEGMVAGDAVNTAARVQSVAEPGQVWVDETTRSLTAAAIAFRDAGDHALKGKAEPVKLYAARAVVAEVGGGQRVDGLEAPLTGRDRELRLIKEFFHSAQESLRPRLVVLDGEPGVGKSRLAWELEKYSDGLSAVVRWHRGRCLSYGDGVAFWALAEAIRSRLGLMESDSGDVVAARLDEWLTEFVTDDGEGEWIRPRVAALVGAGPAGSFAREDLFAAWATFLERVGEGQHVVVLVLEDAQYADDGLLDFVDYLLATARAGIFVLALARPELLSRRHDLGGRRASVIRLDPLEDAAMTRLVDGLVVGLPDQTRSAVVARSEGIPLFAVETVRALIDRDLVVPRGGHYVPADNVDLDLDTIGAPASLQALVAARLDALTPPERRVVALASVLGASFSREGLMAAGDESVDLDAVLSSLQRKEIVSLQTDRQSAERGQFKFVQSVVRQVAYSTQSRRDRKQRHQAAASYLLSLPDDGGDLAVVIAQHLLDAIDASSSGDGDVDELTSQACGLLERAAARARSLGAPAESQRLLETALSRTADPGEQARFHLAASQAARFSGRYEAGAEHATEATVLFDRLGMSVDAGISAAEHGFSLGRLQDNAAAAEIAQPRWQALEAEPGAARALLPLARVLGDAARARGDLLAMAYFADRCILLAEALNEPEALANAYSTLGIRYMSAGAPTTARVMFESGADLAKEHGLIALSARSLNNLAIVQMSRDLGSALEFAREGMEVARRSGVADLLDITTLNYLLALWTTGRLTEARSLLTHAQESAVDPGVRLTLDSIQGWCADAFGTPMPDRVDATSTDAAPDLAWLANLDLLRARADGKVAEAARISEQALPHLLAGNGIEDDFMHLWPPMVRSAIAAADFALAQKLLAPVESAGVGIVSPAVAAQLLWLRGLLGAARGDTPVDVEADLRAGVAALEAFGAIPARAQAEQQLGRWLASQGRHAEAETLISRARSTYAEIGATAWLAALDAEAPATVA